MLNKRFKCPWFSGGSLAWSNPQHWKVAIGIPLRSSGVEGEPGWGSWSSGLLPFLPPSGLSQLHALQPQSLSGNASHLWPCQSWEQDLSDSICLLYSLPSSFSALLLTLWSPPYSCLFLREGGGKTQAFPGLVGWDDVLGEDRARLLVLVPRIWEEGKGDGHAHQKLPAFFLSSCPGLTASPHLLSSTLELQQETEGGISEPSGKLARFYISPFWDFAIWASRMKKKAGIHSPLAQLFGCRRRGLLFISAAHIET